MSNKTSPFDVASEISKGLAQNAIAAKVRYFSREHLVIEAQKWTPNPRVGDSLFVANSIRLFFCNPSSNSTI